MRNLANVNKVGLTVVSDKILQPYPAAGSMLAAIILYDYYSTFAVTFLFVYVTSALLPEV